jgi:hypothetical protein
MCCSSKEMNATIVRGPMEGNWAPGYYYVLFEDPDGIRRLAALFVLFSLAIVMVGPGGTGMCDVVFRFARDSPLEGRVSSEPVSESGVLGPGNTARFREVYGS